MVTSSRDESQQAVKVSKPSGNGSTIMKPASYLDMLLTSHKLFDGEPMFWRQFTTQHLTKVSEDVLMALTFKIARQMLSDKRVSVSWGLLWWEELRRRDIPTPAGFVTALLYMCDFRRDLYGACEVLQMAKLERRRQQQEAAYFEKYKSAYERLYSSSVDDHDEVTPLLRKDVVELMPTSAWQSVFRIVNGSGGGYTWQRDSSEAYTEVSVTLLLFRLCRWLKLNTM